MGIYGINYSALFVSVLFSLILGFIWYGPLFGKTWIKLSGIARSGMKKAKHSDMSSSYTLMIISSLVTFFILGFIISIAGYRDYFSGAILGFFIWIGFIATYSSGSVLWEKKSWSLWLINNLYQLIIFAFAGAILSGWR